MAHSVTGVLFRSNRWQRKNAARGDDAAAVQDDCSIMESRIGEEEGAQQTRADSGVQRFSSVGVVPESHAVFQNNQCPELIFCQVLNGGSDFFGNFVQSALVEKEIFQIHFGGGLADAGECSPNFRLEEDDDGDNAESRQIAQ